MEVVVFFFLFLPLKSWIILEHKKFIPIVECLRLWPSTKLLICGSIGLLGEKIAYVILRRSRSREDGCVWYEWSMTSCEWLLTLTTHRDHLCHMSVSLSCTLCWPVSKDDTFVSWNTLVKYLILLQQIILCNIYFFFRFKLCLCWI